MTQTTIDPTTAEALDLIRALAEKPCPDCNGTGKGLVGGRGGGGHIQSYGEVPCVGCDGTGLANPWASKDCRNHTWHRREYYLSLGYVDIMSPKHCKPDCNSGRVPKAVGLEELFEHGIMSVAEHSDGGYFAVYGTPLEGTSMKVAVSQGKGETPLLAALRAKVRSQQP